MSRKDFLTFESKLFKVHDRHFNEMFKELNRKLKPFLKNKDKHFTSKTLRTLNATLLYKYNYSHDEEKEKFDIALTKEQIDLLHGRAEDATEAAYFKKNPEIPRKNYEKALPLITVLHAYSAEDFNKIVDEEAEIKANEITEDIKQELAIKSENEKVMQSEIDSIKETLNIFLKKID